MSPNKKNTKSNVCGYNNARAHAEMHEHHISVLIHSDGIKDRKHLRTVTHFRSLQDSVGMITL